MSSYHTVTLLNSTLHCLPPLPLPPLLIYPPSNAPLGSAVCAYGTSNTVSFGSHGRSGSLFDVYRSDLTSDPQDPQSLQTHTYTEVGGIVGTEREFSGWKRGRGRVDQEVEEKRRGRQRREYVERDIEY